VAERRYTAAGARTPALAERLTSGDVHAPHADRSPAGKVDPRSLMQRLDGLLPAARTVTVDGGHSSGFPSVYLTVPDHRGYLFPLEFASIGLGLGTAIGAAVGRPDRLSVLVVGDGALMMSLPEVETAARAGLPVVVVVMNDGAYGSELHILAAGGRPPELSLSHNPSFAALAEAAGGRGATVQALDELEAVGGLLEGLDGPLVLDCAIDPAVHGPWMQGAFHRSLRR
jgi:thiamine pyrophosphate-dependent acetolactate synthase large subunit-like protein